MPETTAAPVATGLRIVLFGMPAAGKSSLLGALAQAGQVQANTLGGQLVDVGGGLADLQQRVYANRAQETLEEIVPYPVTFTPAPSKDQTGGAVPITLYDCDGRAAQDYMSKKRSLDQAGKDDDLARAVQQADALILVADVSAGNAQLAKDFTLFGQFLQMFQEHRGRRTEVGGLPVHLVLTKCDLLAMPSDTGQQWLQRIKEQMADVRRRFESFLNQQGKQQHFGRIHLQMAATAVKRPALADRAAKPQEPLGVAELFKQCLESARSYAGLRETAQGQLHRTVVGIAVVVAVLGILAAIFFLTRPDTQVTALENSIRGALPTANSTAPKRLEGNLEEKLKQLTGFQASPDFARLDPKVREEVNLAASEIRAYQKLGEQIKRGDWQVRLITREDDLVVLEKFLIDTTAPDEFAEAWSDTDLVKRLEERRRETQALRKAVNDEDGWFKEQIKSGVQLQKQGGTIIAGLATPGERAQWFSQVKDYLEREPRFKANDRLPGAPSVTFANVYQFRKVEVVRKDWEGFKRKLEDLKKQVP